MAFAAPVIMAASALGAAAQVYSTVQQAKDAKEAAKFNAEQARKAAKVKKVDDRENALRAQEENRKYLAQRTALMLDKGEGGIEGADLDFMNEEVGNLELRILDATNQSNRSQASFANQAFSYEFQGKQAARAGKINAAASVLGGFNSIASAGVRQGYFKGSGASPLN